MTGLLNRWGFNAAAEAALAVAERTGAPVAIFMCDLDHFKSINDRFGHAIGDRVLQIFAETARRNIPSPDLIGRLGGEEFAAVLYDVSDERAVNQAERIRTAFQDPISVSSDPARAEDEKYVESKYDEVRASLQDGMDTLARRRRLPLFG